MITVSKSVWCWIVVIALTCGGIGVPAVAQEEADIEAESQELLESIEQALAKLSEIRAETETAEGEQLQVLERRRLDIGVGALDELDALIDNIVELEQQGRDTAEFREPAEELVLLIPDAVRRRVEELTAKITELASKRDAATGEERVRLEVDIAEQDDVLSKNLEAALNNTANMEALGLDASAEETYLADLLGERAETLAARIEIAVDQAKQVQERLAEKPDDADLKTELAATQARLDRSTKTLQKTIGMLEKLDVDTAQYRRLVIEATGQITADILNKDVALSLVGQWTNRIRTWVVDNGPTALFKLLVFVLILFVFHLLAKLTRRVVAKAVQSSKLHFSQLLQKMFVNTAGNVVWIVGVLVGLSQLGFALGPILAGLGIMGFIVGFALQETLGNFAAGMMILVYRPYDVGDLIEASGVFGRVSAMSMVSTTILTLDHQTLVVPNGKIWGDVIKNVTAQKVRRVDMVFGVSYSDEIPRTEEVLRAILEEHPKILKEPEPMVRLHTLNESSVDFVVRPWCATEDYWNVYWDVTREVKMRFDKEGIHIPFPQRDVHFYEEKRLASAGAVQTS